MMELNLTIFVAISWLSLCVLASSDKIPFKENYFNQTLDHFSYYKPQTFKQRYLVQDKWWNKTSGPVFFYTGNEGDIVEFWDNTGFMFELAPKFNALVVFCEHRFYGRSLPLDANKSFEHPTVDYLTADQALADYAVFIDWLRASMSAPDRPVIAFGGSYGGMLSAYMRFKYPNMVAGALAASAPIYLAAGLGSRQVFFQDVTKDCHDAVPGCDDKVRQAFSRLYELAASGAQGLQKITEVFNLCPTFTSTDSLLHLVGWIRNAFANMAMFDYPYATQFTMKLPPYPIKAACQKITEAADALAGLSAATKMWYGATKCSNIWTEYVECSDPTGCGLGPSGLAWSYQACTDFTMPDGTNNETDMFPSLPWSLQQRTEYCEKRWGITTNMVWPRISLLGKDISSASNIVFSNGKLDPWHRGGVLEDISDTLVAVVIEDSAHHLDLRWSNPADPPSVTQARQIETAWIQKWLHEHMMKPAPNEQVPANKADLPIMTADGLNKITKL